MNFGKMIKERRLALGLTLEQVGDLCGVGKGTVHKWETGQIGDPGMTKLRLLANALQMSLDDLVDADDVVMAAATGTPPTDLSTEELLLITVYRSASPDRRDRAIRVLTGQE